MAIESSAYLRVFQAFWRAFEQHDYEQCATMMADDFQWMIRPKSLKYEPVGRDIWKVMVSTLFGEGFPKGEPKVCVQTRL